MSLLKVNQIESLQGATGTILITGQIIANGEPLSGATGPTGPSGTSGTSGISSGNGPTGPTGPSGTSGTSGLQGETGSIGPSGSPGTSGTSGTSGLQGGTGPQGETGPLPVDYASTGSNTFYGSQTICGPTGTSFLILCDYNYLNATGDSEAASKGIPLGGVYQDNGILRIRIS